eukprot:7161531-Pyramimonas_sp.AAC.2
MASRPTSSAAWPPTVRHAAPRRDPHPPSFCSWQSRVFATSGAPRFGQWSMVNGLVNGQFYGDRRETDQCGLVRLTTSLY